MIKKICCIVNYNLYESKKHFSQKLGEALFRQGVEMRIIDVQQNNGALDFSEIQWFKPDFTCSFNSVMPINNKFFFDLTKIPHLSILVDPSIYAVNLTNSPYSIISCVDRGDCDGLRSTNNFQNVFFLPHAVEKELNFKSDSTRDLDVVFIGSCYDYESLKNSWQKIYPKEINAVLDHAIHLVESDQYTSLTQALVTAWSNAKISPEGVDFVKLFYYLDNYTRGKDRVELIRSVKEAKVHVFGELMIEEPAYKLSWEHYLGKQANVILHSSVPFAQSLEILKRSKICLNSMPFFKDGSHERIFTSLASGSVPITSNSKYIKEMFKDGEDLIIYKTTNFNEVNDQVNLLLNNEERRKSMASNGREKVMRDHTWDKRAEQLINEISPIISRMNA